MINKFKHIELFAGCGGMTLGLESAGFELFFANELSPMAAETFAYNILDDNIKNPSKNPQTYWLRSQYERNDNNRLRENPYEYHKGNFSDLKTNTELKNKLIIGDIIQLNEYLRSNSEKTNEIRKQNIDIVSGGPPCQSFSLAGKREIKNKRNQLPWAFAEFVELIQPKTVILENVSGILRPFKHENKKYYAWFEVAKAFCLKGYVPICMHINAKFFGLPQNRPRFIMFAIRYNIAQKLDHDDVLKKGINLFHKVKKEGKDLGISPDDYFFELNTKKHIKEFEESRYLISPITVDEEDQKTVSYAIDYIKNLPDKIESSQLIIDSYHNHLDSFFKPRGSNYIIKNHEQRKHSNKIKQRFRILKLIEEFENGDKIKLLHAIKTGSIVEFNSTLKKEVIRKLKDVSNEKELEAFFAKYQSKKHSQRALNKDKPAPAALSIPDDVCHYDREHNRTLTVREMARIQSFPDWFEFRSKDTTGGTNRRFEVPNYTQVGNAVPPLLARELGIWVQSILTKI